MFRAKEWPYERAQCVQKKDLQCNVAGIENLGLGLRQSGEMVGDEARQAKRLEPVMNYRGKANYNFDI